MVRALIATILIATPLCWLAGEQHRANCIQQVRVECSMLPWQDGRPAMLRDLTAVQKLALPPRRIITETPTEAAVLGR